MRLTLLGTGSPVPSLSKAGSGYLVEVGDDRIVVDMGPGALRRLLRLGLSVHDVSHFFLSHLHIDHFFDFLMLFHHRWDRQRDLASPLNIYGPPGFRLLMEKVFGVDGAFAADISGRIDHPVQRRVYERNGGRGASPWPDYEVNELVAGDVVTGSCWRAVVDDVPHYQPFLENLGIRIESDDAVMAYTSDISIERGTKLSDPRLDGLKRLERGAHIVVQHLNGQRAISDTMPPPPMPILFDLAAKMAAECGVQTLVTTHHGPTIDQPHVRNHVIKEMATYFGGEIVWGEDLMAFDVCPIERVTGGPDGVLADHDGHDREEGLT